MSAPFKIGDKVKMMSPTTQKFTKKDVWEVVKINKSQSSQSGWIVSCAIGTCPHCGQAERLVDGFDSGWFRLVP